jgi:hypothetical protein
LVTERNSVLFVFVPVFELRGPKNEEDSAAAQEECMSAVIDVLPAKIPPVDMEGPILTSGPNPQLLSPNLNAMGGLNGFVERLVAKTPAELGLSYATITKKDDFHFVIDFRTKVELRKVGAQPREAVVSHGITRKQFRRYTDSAVDKEHRQVREVDESSEQVNRNRGSAFTHLQDSEPS